MYKFAHLADCHIGSQKYPELKKLEIKSFKNCLDKCIEEKVDFIIISGDLFHSNLPNLGAVKEAVEKMKEVKDRGIEIYVNYGSHDYSPNETSIIDLLDSAGLIRKIVQGYMEDNKLKLNFYTDQKTGAKICGLSARKRGLELNYFKKLDMERLEKESGFKIFVFHSAITDYKPEFLSEMESIPLSFFPKHFNYYAGGHVHLHSHHKPENYGHIVYPGPTFGYNIKDLEITAKGEKRGFYLVKFQEEVEEVEFISLPIGQYIYWKYDATDKNSLQIQEDMLDKIDRLDVLDKIVLLKISGEMSGGRISDINSYELKNVLMQKGAYFVAINKHGLTSKEQAKVKVKESDIPSIERKIFKERIGDILLTQDQLKNDDGLALANELLRSLRDDMKINEKKKDYNERMFLKGLQVLGLEGVYYAD